MNNLKRMSLQSLLQMNNLLDTKNEVLKIIQNSLDNFNVKQSFFCLRFRYYFSTFAFRKITLSDRKKYVILSEIR